MCVTNITIRRNQPISLPNQHQVAASSCSGLTARLIGTFELKSPEANQPARNVTSFPQHQQVGDNPMGGCPLMAESRRRRKPQKPGKTAKQNERHFVVHNYRDHAHDEEGDSESAEAIASRASFPYKIHAILDQVERDGLADVISWQSHGRCFIIHKPKEFVESLMPDYFGQTKFTSFQRQLNLYGFSRLTRGVDAGGYYHELFLRGKPFLVKRMTRTKIKGTKYKAASSPDQEPNFYRMEPVLVSPPTSPMSVPKSIESTRSSAAAQATHALSGGVQALTLNPTSSASTSPAPQARLAPSGGIQTFSLNPPCRMMEPVPMEHVPFPYAPSMNFESVSEPSSIADDSNDADDVLDQAVEELFDDDSNEMSDMNDFAKDWSPMMTMGNDQDLGFALDLLLETI